MAITEVILEAEESEAIGLGVRNRTSTPREAAEAFRYAWGFVLVSQAVVVQEATTLPTPMLRTMFGYGSLPRPPTTSTLQ